MCLVSERTIASPRRVYRETCDGQTRSIENKSRDREFAQDRERPRTGLDETGLGEEGG